MKKFMTTLIGLVIAGGIAYAFYQNSLSTAVIDDVMVQDDAMMKEDEMMDGEAATGDGAMMEDKAAPGDGAMMEENAVYTAYSDGVIGNGETSILFFHATWCPSCKKANTDLTEIYGTDIAKVSTYKVDYDSHADLKQKYGVTSQHTFVVIDGEGNALKVVAGPSKDQLTALVQ